jgi:hypothetical protein
MIPKTMPASWGITVRLLVVLLALAVPAFVAMWLAP